VERNNGVHEDRLVKKLRRQGIQSYEATNEYLEAETFCARSGLSGELSRSGAEPRTQAIGIKSIGDAARRHRRPVEPGGKDNGGQE